MHLAELKVKQKGHIVKVRGRGAFRKRILEMGFVAGKEVEVIRNAPLQDPIEYSLMGYKVSLRRSEAELIEITTEEEIKEKHFEGTLTNGELKRTVREKTRNINVALVGNPNAGKTTLFNHASGSRERVANYSGVTVESKEARFSQGEYNFNVADLPGTYSLTAYTPEEIYVRNYIADHTPDVVINVVDASNLERNLYLSTQLIDMDIKVIIALNMHDELLAKGCKFDYEALGKMLGIPIIPTVSNKGRGIKELFDKVIEVYEDRDENVRHVHLNYGREIESSLAELQAKFKEVDNHNLTDRMSPRFLSVKLLEQDKDIMETVKARCKNGDEILNLANDESIRLEKLYSDYSETIVTDAKYGFIAGALKETMVPGHVERRRRTEIVDTIVTHRVFGFPIFLILMWLMFEVTFTVGAYPMDWIDMGVAWLSDMISSNMADGMFKDLLVDGIIAGVGGVIIFLPNILILFLFISLLEDTGYMARAVFIMDKVMHKFGLHGKSFIPLLMGIGCNVPAIMATRTIESKNDRLVTMLVNPFMSCGARLPVYVLLISAFFTKNSGLMLFLIYSIGVGVAVLSALLLKGTLFKAKDIPFVMELPPYRVPTAKSAFRHMWDKGSQYLRKMGGVILVASIIIWALSYFPQDLEYTQDYDSKIETLTSAGADVHEEQIRELELKKESERVESSYIGQIGKTIEPVLTPLGFDWRMSAAVMTGLAAKEIVVSTMGVLYNADSEADEESEALMFKLKEQTYKSGSREGEKVFSPLVAFSLMLFVLLYVPCIAVIAAIKKESGSWKWAAFQIVFSTGVAWIISFTVYQIGSLIA